MNLKEEGWEVSGLSYTEQANEYSAYIIGNLYFYYLNNSFCKALVLYSMELVSYE